MDINATIIGQTVAFFFFVVFCMKFVWPPLIEAIEERQKKIAEGLAAADNALQDQELAQKRATELLREAKTQAAEIVEKANKRHAEIVERAKSDAEQEAAKVKASAMSELEQELNRAKDDLRSQLAGLVVSGAEKIIEKDVDEKAHAKLIDSLVSAL